jgi:hypothetical protein
MHIIFTFFTSILFMELLASFRFLNGPRGTHIQTQQPRLMDGVKPGSYVLYINKLKKENVGLICIRDVS